MLLDVYRVRKKMRYIRITAAIIVSTSMLLTGCNNKKENTDETPTITESYPETSSGPAVEAQVESELLQSTTEPITELVYNKALLPCITIKDGFTIADYGESEGNDYTYAVYRLAQMDRPDNDREQYWEVVVMREREMMDVLRIENEEYGAAFPSPSEVALEYDVNFDGVNDILLCLGHFGNQGLIAYKCYLADGGAFKLCPSFAGIANPSVDSDTRVVRSQWRNYAASHSWGIYRYQDDAFIMTECLTEAEVPDENGNFYWYWEDKVFKDGEWQIREYYTEDDYDTETLYLKRCGPDSYWGLDQDKWNTLFNGGKMWDFSIYAD